MQCGVGNEQEDGRCEEGGSVDRILPLLRSTSASRDIALRTHARRLVASSSRDDDGRVGAGLDSEWGCIGGHRPYRHAQCAAASLREPIFAGAAMQALLAGHHAAA